MKGARNSNLSVALWCKIRGRIGEIFLSQGTMNMLAEYTVVTNIPQAVWPGCVSYYGTVLKIFESMYF